MTRRFFLIVLLLCSPPACITFDPFSLEGPEVFLDRAVLCRQVDARGKWAEPSAEQGVFIIEKDDKVCYYIELRDIRGEHDLRWDWYDHSKKLIRTTEKIVIGVKGKLYKEYIAWDQFAIIDESNAGFWTVAVFLDNKLLSSRDFEIRRDESSLI